MAETTPSFCLRYSNASLGRGLVNISATCSLEGTYSNLTFCSSTYSCRKWYLIGMCLVLECITRFFEILVALVLSHRMEMGGEHLIWISCNGCIIQRSWVQHDAATTYSASAVDKAIELCFLLNQDTNRGPIYNAPPLLLFQSSILPAQSASVYAWRVRSAFFGYHSPKSWVPCRYLNIIFTAWRWDSFGLAWNHPTIPTTCIMSGLVPVR